MSKKHKKVYWNFLILVSKSTAWVSISAFASLIGIPIGITTSPIVLKVMQ